MGAGAQGKRSGTGAMTDLPDDVLPDNMVLGNRDKSRHGDERGLDGKNVQTEQDQDHAGNRRNPGDEAAADGNTSGLTNPMTDTSAEASRREV